MLARQQKPDLSDNSNKDEEWGIGKYVPLSLQRHTLQEVATLIEQSAPSLLSVMFGSHMISILGRLVELLCEHRYIRVMELDGHVVGIAILIPAVAI
jgi:hypothetical protein